MRRNDLKAAVVLPLILGASVFMGPDAHADSPMKKSLYRGDYWTAELAECRSAIMRRESNYNYRASNPTSSAQGAYQFLDSQWRESLVHMMRKETRKSWPFKLDRLEQLNDTPIRKWPKFFQDFAFYRVANSKEGQGLLHWSPLPSACNGQFARVQKEGV